MGLHKDDPSIKICLQNSGGPFFPGPDREPLPATMFGINSASNLELDILAVGNKTLVTTRLFNFNVNCVSDYDVAKPAVT